VATIVGRISVARALGRAIVGEPEPESRFQATRSFVIGSAAIVVALMVPVLGLLAWLFIGSFGLGAATMTFFGTLRRERPATPPMPAAGPEAPPVQAPPMPPAAAYSAAPVPGPAAGPAAFAAEPAAFTAEPAPPASPPHAAPPPVTAAGGARDLTLYPRAAFFDRLAAIALDFVLVGIALAFFDLDRDHYRGPGPFFLLLFAYHVAFWTWKGTTRSCAA
jgi:hypothetical protein